MTIPSLLTILSAPGSTATTTSAVSGAELPGSGQVGFASLVQMLLGQQQAPAPAAHTAQTAQTAPGQAADDGDPTQPATADGPATGPAAVPGAEADATRVPARSSAPVTGSAAGLAPGTGALLGPAVSADTAPRPEATAPDTHQRAGSDVDDAATEDTDAAPAPAAEGLLGVPAPATPPAPAAGGGAARAGSSVPAAPVADAPTTTRTAHDGADLPAQSPARAIGAAGTTAMSGATAPSGTPAKSGTPTPSGTAPGASRDADATVATGTTATVPPQHAPDPGPTPPVGAVGVAAPSVGTTQPTAAPAGSAPAAAPVAGQVFPEVARLVTRGDGTQRLTLRLSPENLGEVRIVVTVRDGGVDVRLAAGAEAQDALRHGSADLRRLLESVGATSTQIVVRDLPGAASSATGTSPSQPSATGAAATYADTGGGHGRDQQRGDASGHRPNHQTSGPAHTGVRPQPAASTAPAAAAGVDLRL